MSRPALILLPIIYLGFISLGLPDGTLGVAWPQLHTAIGAPVGFAGVIMFAITLLAGISGFNSGRVIARFKTGPIVLISCAMTGSALMLVSFAQGPLWLVAAALPLGLGAGAVDAGLNGYVARHYSGRHMNWLHACWGLGATCGPLVMAWALDTPTGWRAGYFWIAAAQLSLALLFLATLRLWSAVPERTADTSPGVQAIAATPRATAHSLAGWLSAAIFTLYVAIETTTGLWASSILVLSRGFAESTAGTCAAAYYGAIGVGRLLSGVVIERIGNRRLVMSGAVTAVGGAGLFLVADSTPLAATALVLLGLGFAPIYPGLMHEVPRRFVPEAVQVIIGRQSGSAYLGAATLPTIAGWVAQRSLESVGWLVIGGAVLMLLAIRRLDRLT